MVYRKQPDEIRDPRPVLDAMGRCRNALITAHDQVTPFGLTYRALSLVIGAIDTAAWFLTGDNHFYAAPASTTPHQGWEDSGR